MIPDATRKQRLTDIQKWLADFKEDGHKDSLARAVQLMVEEPDFVRHAKANPELSKGAKDAADLTKFAWAYLMDLLYRRDVVAASMILWDRETFCAEPYCAQLVWNALMSKRMIMVLGGGGVGKTFNTSAYFLLQYILDPQWTKFQVASASQEHLLGNLFSDIGRLHSSASMPLPGKHDTKSIAIDKKSAQGIFTLTLPGGSVGKSKIKGAHTKARPIHPLFGRRSRVFCLIDEGQEAPQNIFEEIANRFSTVMGDDVEHIKFVICANPRDIFSRLGRAAQPSGGWEKITRDHDQWQSRSGWTVISIDQTKTENIREKRDVFPGLATYTGYKNLLADCDDDPEHPRMYSLCYGKFPQHGSSFSIIKQRYLLASEGEWIFAGSVTPIAGCDPAYTGDRPAFISGRAGMAIGWFGDDGVQHKLEQQKMVIQIDSAVILPHGDTQELADQCMTRLKDLGVAPEQFGIDQTGRGLGTADNCRHQWAQKVRPLNNDGQLAAVCGIEYAKSPTETKIATEDTKMASEQYDRIATELWYAAAKYFELDVVRIGKGVPIELYSELAARRGEMQPGLGRKLTVEGKDVYKKRTGGKSPDLADAALVMIHAARMSVPGLMPKAKDTKIEAPKRSLFSEPAFGQAFGAADIQGMPSAEVCDMVRD